MRCRTCESKELESILDLGLQPWGNDFKSITNVGDCNKYPLELFFCSKCSLTQIGYTVPKEVMFINHKYLSGTTQTLKNHFIHTSKKLIKQCNLVPNSLILDIGGNDGTYLEYFHREGYRTLNVDSGVHQSAISKAKGIPTVNDFFSTNLALKILSEFSKAKIIHASGVLFHLEKLHDVFQGIKLVLAEDGILVAEFIYLPEMIDNLAYDQIYHEHLLYYTLNSLQELLKQFDLEIFDCDFYPIHGGTCVAYISHLNLNNRTKRFIVHWENEIKKGFCSSEPLQTFANEVKKSSFQLRQLIEKTVRSGLTVHAIGAPVKGSTLINFAGINEDLIPFAVETNSLKFNTYLPGTRIKVVEEGSIEYPDVYLLLAWNFRDEIVSKFEDFFRSGGKMIIPIPYPTEVTY
jgi:hypothetical protein